MRGLYTPIAVLYCVPLQLPKELGHLTCPHCHWFVKVNTKIVQYPGDLVGEASGSVMFLVAGALDNAILDVGKEMTNLVI